MKVFTAYPLALVVALCLTISPLFAADGLLIVQKNTVGTSNRPTRAQIEKDRMRTDVEGPNGEKQVIIFDASKEVLTVMYPDRKTYSELTKAEADQIGVKIAPEAQEQIKKMTPEQRALMEKMLRGRSNVPAPVKFDYRKAGSDKVGKWACDKYEGYQDKVKRVDICTVAPATLGVAQTDFGITKQMAVFLARIAPGQAPSGFEVGTLESTGFSGVPVRTIGYGTKGEVVYSSEIESITRQTFPASSYEVPAGFQKQPLFGGGRGRGRGQQ